MRPLGCLLVIAIVLVGSAVPGTAGPPPGPAERTILHFINAERTNHDLSPLEWDPDLSWVARQHALDMVRNRYFSHYSPSTGWHVHRVQRANITFRTVAENLARAGSLEQAHTALMNSRTHRSMMLRPAFHRVGLAAIRDASGIWVVVQLFVEDRASIAVSLD